MLLLLIAGINFTIGWRPFLGPKARATNDRKIERTAERVDRGRYLTGLLGCESCHSPKNWKGDGAPDVPGMQLAGQMFPLPGLPGDVVAPNLTPDAETGAATWSDDQIARSIREGIGHDGRAIFPIMPYRNYLELSDEDVDSVVVFLRLLPAVRNPLPANAHQFSRELSRAKCTGAGDAVGAPSKPGRLDRKRKIHGEAGMRLSRCCPQYAVRRHGKSNGALGRCEQRQYYAGAVRDWLLRRSYFY